MGPGAPTATREPTGDAAMMPGLPDAGSSRLPHRLQNCALSGFSERHCEHNIAFLATVTR
jgi:hypothetical protein